VLVCVVWPGHVPDSGLACKKHDRKNTEGNSERKGKKDRESLVKYL
jgi:hypothetical protein